jgi:hypothetical protein
MGRNFFGASRAFALPIAASLLLLLAWALSFGDHASRSTARDLPAPAVIAPAFGDVSFGNPAAPAVVVFVSETCPHCLRWERE